MTETPLTPKERIERAEQEVVRLCGSGPGGHLNRSFRMTIPADPDRDSDLVLMDGLAAGREAIATLDATGELDVERLARALHRAINVESQAIAISDPYPGEPDDWERHAAEAIAREYAALGDSDG